MLSTGPSSNGRMSGLQMDALTGYIPRREFHHPFEIAMVEGACVVP